VFPVLPMIERRECRDDKFISSGKGRGRSGGDHGNDDHGSPGPHNA
jgi:hypothetical protein